MGTNYYCETGRMLDVECDCGFTHRMPEVLHIGKDSYGWKFMLHTIPEKGLLDFRKWSMLLDSSPRIFDEYGEALSVDRMKRLILKKPARRMKKADKEHMKETAQKHGYLLDEDCWLFSGRSERQGNDGNYAMVEGDFS